MFGYRESDELKGRRVKRSNLSEIQPQEVFLDNLSRDKEGVSERKMEVSISRNSFRFLAISLFLIVSILLLRTFQLQILMKDSYKKKAERNRFAYALIDNSRGVVYDKRGEQLVYNEPSFSLVFNREEVDDWQEAVEQITSIIDLEFDEVMDKIANSSSDDIVIIGDIPREELILLEVKIRELPGFRIENRSIRSYQYPEAFSHIMGYIGKISPEELSSDYTINSYVGRDGIEYFYESALRVTPGKMKVERDSRGKILSEEIDTVAESGNNLTLWIDAEFQKKIYQVLEKKVEELGVKNASVVAIDPRNGGVLAMVNYPGFDNNLFSKGYGFESLFEDKRSPLLNRIIAGNYAVGSTIKPLIGLSALEERIISPEKELYSSGHLLGDSYADLAPVGWYNMRRAIAQSSNIYFYIIGGGYQEQRGLGVSSIGRYLNLFGWGDSTGIDLPGEKSGFIPTSSWKKSSVGDDWRRGDDYNLSIGQGYLTVTPLQVASAFVAIANGGELLKPMIVHEVTAPNGEVIARNEKSIVRSNFFDSKNLEVVKEGMRDAVKQGSAITLNSLSVSSAAKTGTAQIPKKEHFDNWVTVFAPYEEPEIVLVVLIEEVYGIRAVALPVAKELLEWYFIENEAL